MDHPLAESVLLRPVDLGAPWIIGTDRGMVSSGPTMHPGPGGGAPVETMEARATVLAPIGEQAEQRQRSIEAASPRPPHVPAATGRA
jgi:hypothetical protein